MLALVALRDTRIGLWTVAIGAKEPGQIRGAVLLVTAEVVDTRSTEVAKQQCAVARTVAVAIALKRIKRCRAPAQSRRLRIDARFVPTWLGVPRLRPSRLDGGARH